MCVQLRQCRQNTGQGVSHGTEADHPCETRNECRRFLPKFGIEKVRAVGGRGQTHAVVVFGGAGRIAQKNAPVAGDRRRAFVNPEADLSRGLAEP